MCSSDLTDIFPAREAPIPGVDGQTLVAAVTEAGARDVSYVEALEPLASAIAADTRAGDVILTLGAGSIEETAGMLLQELKREPAHA